MEVLLVLSSSLLPGAEGPHGRVHGRQEVQRVQHEQLVDQHGSHPEGGEREGLGHGDHRKSGGELLGGSTLIFSSQVTLTVENTNAYQLVTAIGAAMKCFDNAIGLNVPR